MANFKAWLAEAAAQASKGSTPAAAPAPAAPQAPAEPPLLPPKDAEKDVGLSGTVNWSGRLQTESNTKLKHEQAYGQPGQTAWGEWEKLHRTDPAVSTALNLIVAPLRDAELEVEAAPEPKPKPGAAPTAAEDEPRKSQAPVPPGGGSSLPPSPGERSAEAGAPTAEDANGPEPMHPPEEAQTQNQRIAEFVRDCFMEWLDPTWPTLLEQMVTYGLGYGFSLHEVVWGTREDERVPGGVAMYPKRLAQRLPSSVKSNGWIERDGDLAIVKQSGVRTLPDGTQRWDENIELPADKIVLATWNRSGNNYAGFPAFRPVWYLATIRADLARIIAIGHQREACGVPVAEVDKDVSLTDEQREDLQTLLENVVYHENAGFQLPPGVKLSWFFSPGANKSNVLETWRALGVAILEVVQAQQSALGTDNTGSRAVGEVHATAQSGFVAGVRAWVEATLNGVGERAYTGLVRKIVDLNFGPQKSYPKVKLVTKQHDMDPAALAQGIKTLVDAGALTLSADDENMLRERFGLKPVDPAVREAEKERKRAIASSIASGMGAPAPADDEDEPTAKAPVVDPAAMARKLAELEQTLGKLRGKKTLAELLGD